ncbi:MAG: hypothetical protein Q9212_006826 [Teloschistes hypoglaucus]
MHHFGLEDNQKSAYVVRVGIAFGIIDTVAVLLRLIARWRSKAAFAADDWWIVWSLVPLCSMVAVGTLMATIGGLGQSNADLSPTNISALMKISLLLLYRRIFDTAAFRKRSLILGVACLLWFVVGTVMTFTLCRPFPAFFDPEGWLDGRCMSLRGYYIGTTASNLILDIVMFLLPVDMIWKLTLRSKQKVALTGIFSIGLLSCIAAAIRIDQSLRSHLQNITVSITNVYLWSQIEPATAILCACLITYKPLFKNMSISLSASIFTSYFSRRGSETTKEEQGGDVERQIRYERPTVREHGCLGSGMHESGVFAEKGEEKERPVVLTRVVS